MDWLQSVAVLTMDVVTMASSALAKPNAWKVCRTYGFKGSVKMNSTEKPVGKIKNQNQQSEVKPMRKMLNTASETPSEKRSWAQKSVLCGLVG